MFVAFGDFFDTIGVFFYLFRAFFENYFCWKYFDRARTAASAHVFYGFVSAFPELQGVYLFVCRAVFADRVVEIFLD